MISSPSVTASGADGAVIPPKSGGPPQSVELKPVVLPEIHRPSPVEDKPRVTFDPATVQKNLKEAVEMLNKQMASSGRNLGFTIDEVLRQPIVKVVNTSTGEVVRQIPSEAVVKVAHTFEMLKGLLHDASS